jgi:murein tripeptide amidase MpaA
VREIGRSYQGRPLFAVEIGREEADAPTLVQTQTPQPSEMGSLTCKALIDYLCSDAPAAADLRRRFRFGFVPMTNPDGTVLGYVVSDAQGRFAFLEGHRAAAGDPQATPETVAVWRYLNEMQPWLFWEWHSNNWSRRSGHMLIRYRHELIQDEAKRRLWARIEDRLLTLPDTVHENWTSHTEGPYQRSMGFQAVTRLGIISTMIKHHDRFPLEVSQRHAIDCLKIATDAYPG